MSLSERQAEFIQALGKLLEWVHEWDQNPNNRLTFGCGRCREIGHHIQGSYHYMGLAQDINLFLRDPVTGKWTWQTTTEAHREMGEFWESLGGTWGGRFRRPDGNHYSWGEGR